MKLTLAQKTRSDRKGPQPVYVRISHGGKEAYVSLGVSVKPKDWNSRRGEIRASHRDADALTGLLSARLATAQRAAATVVLEEGREVSVADVKAAVVAAVHPERVEERAVPILPWMRAEVERHYAGRGKVSTALSYGTALNNLEASLRDQKLVPERLLAAELTLPVLLAHRDRLERPDRKGGMGHAPNHVHKQVTTLRALLRRADRAGVPGAADALAAAERVEVQKERAEKVRLSIEQVRAYLDADLTGRAADVRDWWCAAFFFGGMRLGDVCRLRWSDIVRAEPSDSSGAPATPRLGDPVAYRMRTQKTGARAALPLAPEAAAIVRRWEARTLGPDSARPSPYVFGLITEDDELEPLRLRQAVDRRGALARKYLKLAATAMGWPGAGETGRGKGVGFHTARHSLAQAMVKGGASLYSVSKTLNHTKLSTTQQYLASFDDELVGREMLNALRAPAGGGEDGKD